MESLNNGTKYMYTKHQPNRILSHRFVGFSHMLRVFCIVFCGVLALPRRRKKIEEEQKGLLQAAQRLNLMDDRLMQASGAGQDKASARGGAPDDQGGEGGGAQGPVRDKPRPNLVSRNFPVHTPRTAAIVASADAPRMTTACLCFVLFCFVFIVPTSTRLLSLRSHQCSVDRVCCLQCASFLRAMRVVLSGEKPTIVRCATPGRSFVPIFVVFSPVERDVSALFFFVSFVACPHFNA